MSTCVCGTKQSNFSINKSENERPRIGKTRTLEPMDEIVYAANCPECGPDRPSLNADWLEISTLYYYASVCAHLELHG